MNVVDLNTQHDVRVLAGANMVLCAPSPPFSEEACLFLEAMSRTLMRDARTKHFPDVVSFAFWCRKSNVLHEKELRKHDLEKRIGRGFSFHIAPGNVPVNFAFSYACSLLAGNAAVVRCPSKPFDQVRIILDAFRRCFDEFPSICERSSFVSYPSSGDATAFLSKHADVRIVWGGDATVLSVKLLESKPRCVDIAFADRYSIAILSAEKLSSLDGGSMARIAHAFYNDTYLMDQNACSSPQTIIWVGSDDAVNLVHGAFWDAVETEVKNRYGLQAAVSVDKRVQLSKDIMCGRVSSFEEHEGYLTTAWLAEGEQLSTAYRGVGGYFYEQRIEGLSDIAEAVDEKFQTMVQFGFDSTNLRTRIIHFGLTGIDRIVPIGKALDIGLVWDGYDLIDAMSRIISAE